MRGGPADEKLTMPGRRNCAGGVIRPGAGADHRRIPHPARRLAGHAPGGGRGGDVACLVPRHRAHRAVPGRIIAGIGAIARPAGQFILQRLPAAIGEEVIRLCPNQAPATQKLQRAFAHQQHALRMLHHRARRQHRIARAENAGHRPGAAILPAHHRRIHLLPPGGGVNRATPSIEMRIIFQRHHRGGHRIQRRAAIRQHGMAGAQRGRQPGTIAGFAGRGHGRGVDGAGAAVDG